MNNIEKQYEELLKSADEIAASYDKEDEELTDKEFEEMIELIGSANPDPAQLFPSNNGMEYNQYTDPERNVTAKVLVSSNPVTGALNTIPYEEENITEESLDRLLDLKDEDLKQVEINWDVFVETTKMI